MALITPHSRQASSALLALSDPVAVGWVFQQPAAECSLQKPWAACAGNSPARRLRACTGGPQTPGLQPSPAPPQTGVSLPPRKPTFWCLREMAMEATRSWVQTALNLVRVTPKPGQVVPRAMAGAGSSCVGRASGLVEWRLGGALDPLEGGTEVRRLRGSWSLPIPTVQPLQEGSPGTASSRGLVPGADSARLSPVLWPHYSTATWHPSPLG